MQGHFLAGRYYVLGSLGHGSFGTVYLAQDRSTEGYVAIKIPVNEREAHLFSSLTLPQVPRCYGVLEHEGNLLLLMEWIRGETLMKYLLRQRRIELVELHQIMAQLCTIFQRLVEREPALLYPDLHWNNLLRESDGRLWLIDFGAALPVERSHAQREAVEVLSFCLRTYLLEFLVGNDLASEIRAWCHQQEQQVERVCDLVQEWDRLIRKLLPAEENASVAPASSLAH